MCADFEFETLLNLTAKTRFDDNLPRSCEICESLLRICEKLSYNSATSAVVSGIGSLYNAGIIKKNLIDSLSSIGGKLTTYIDESSTFH